MSDLKTLIWGDPPLPLDVEFGWKSYYESIPIDLNSLCRRQYGYVRRGGKTFTRNYHREIRNGLTFVDLIEARMREVRSSIQRSMETKPV